LTALSETHFHAQIRTAEMQEKIRQLAAHYSEWFVHITPERNIPSILASGLAPRPVDAICIPEAIGHRPGLNPPILCLSPHSRAHEWRNLQHHEGPFSEIAVHASHLPEHLDLDWSFPPSWNYAGDVSVDCGSSEYHEVFWQTVLRFGVAIIYDAIPSSHLRVWTPDKDRNAPDSWSFLNQLHHKGCSESSIPPLEET